MNMMRIAIIDPIGLKAGLDHYDLSLANALINKSCTVTVYSNFNNTGNKSIVKNHFTFSLQFNWLILIRLLKEYWSALRMIKADKTEIVIVHLFHSSFLDFFFMSLIRFFGFRICLIIHDVESLIILNKKSWICKCVKIARNIIVHNKFSYDELMIKISPADKFKIFIVPHGNYLGLQVKTDRHEIAKYFNLDIKKSYLLFFGMIKKSKGLDLILEAMSNIPANVELIIAGRTRDISFNHYEKIIEKLNLSKRIHPIIRYITNYERNLLFNFADLAILPYKRIYQSGVMLLAMSYEVPVITSDLPANRYILDESIGILFNENNPSDLALKINRLVADKIKKISIAEKAKKYVTVNNDWTKIGNAFLKILDK